MKIIKDPKAWFLFVAGMAVIIFVGHLANMIMAYGRIVVILAVLIFLYRIRSTGSPKD